MADVFTFSEDDAKLLKRMIERERRQVQNTRNRPAPAPDIHPAPDVFVVKAPDGGIPALDAEAGTGTGTGTMGYPGSALCNVYKALLEGQYFKLIAKDGFEKRVFNMSEAVIPAGSWCLAIRDKSGTWWATPAAVSEGGGGGGGAEAQVVTVQLDADLGSDVWRGYIQEPNGLGYTVGAQVRVWVGRHVSGSGYTPNWIAGLILLCQVTPFTSSGFTIVFPQRIESLANLTLSGTVSNTTQSFGGAKHFGQGTIGLGNGSFGASYATLQGTAGSGFTSLLGNAFSGNTTAFGNVTFTLGIPGGGNTVGELYVSQENATNQNGSTNFAVDFENVKKSGQTNPGSIVDYISMGVLIDYGGNGSSPTPLTVLNALFYGGIFCGIGNEYPLTTEHIYHPTTAQSLKDFLDAL